MNTLTFPYGERAHPLFEHITRPFITLHLHSTLFDQWLTLNDILADTGADISVIPLPLGQIFVDNIEHGQPIQLGGSVSSTTMFNAFVHRIRARLGEHTFDMPLAIATSLNIPPIFGRREALDRFAVHFNKGRELLIGLETTQDPSLLSKVFNS